MFKKKKWLIVSILAAVIVVAMGAMGVSAYAKSGGSTAGSAPTSGVTSVNGDNTTATRVDPQKVLADKVASILGLDTATVEAAFTQAQKEINSENAAANLKAEESRIDQMATDGKITADEAAQLKTWLESRPNVDIPGLNLGGMMGGRQAGPNGFGGRAMPPPGSEATANPDTTNSEGAN